MAVLTTTLGAVVTPAATPFLVQCNGGTVMLERRNSAAAAWCNVQRIPADTAITVANPVAGADYRVTPVDSAAITISVDQ